MIRICLVGVGSIGARHLRNLTALLRRRGEAFAVDALRSGERPLSAETEALLRTQYHTWEALPSNYDVALICNPTHLHFDTVKRMAAKARHLFIEKPVFDATDRDLSELGLTAGGVYYVACPLRYTAVIQYLKTHVNDRPIHAARAICSTYLPDWRPGQDYRRTYSAHRDQGGGVSIDLVHEWDYLCYLFGLPQQVENMRGQYSALELDSDDLSVYIGRYPDKLVSLHLDYFGAVERREVELYMDGEVVVGDLRAQHVRYLKSGTTIALDEPRDAYQTRELEHFLDMIAGRAENDNPIRQAVSVLKLAKGETP